MSKSRTQAERIATYVDTYGYSTEVAIATVNHEDAQAAEWALNSKIEDEFRAAKEAIRAKYRAETTAAQTTRYEAEKALDAAKITDANRDNRIGMKVQKVLTRYKNLWDHKATVTTIFGVVEVRTEKTVFAGNMRYLPPMGSIFVRILKNDGTPGSRIDTSMGGWEVVA